MNFQTKAQIFFLFVIVVSCCFIGESMAGKKGKGGGEDIILYNGNIVMRGGGKGKGMGSIVVANSQPSHSSVEMMPHHHFHGYEHFGRRK